MDKLIEIAEECGANSYADCNVTLRGENICLSPEQLQAYTEKVCKQMVEALGRIADKRNIHFSEDACAAAKQALAAYTEIMGDKK